MPPTYLERQAGNDANAVPTSRTSSSSCVRGSRSEPIGGCAAEHQQREDEVTDYCAQDLGGGGRRMNGRARTFGRDDHIRSFIAHPDVAHVVVFFLCDE